MSKQNNPHDGHRARMRARHLLDMDFSTFQPHEILEFILFIGIPRRNTNEIAHALLSKFHNLPSVFNASVAELLSVKGVTVQAAHTIVSILPIARIVNASVIRTNKRVVKNVSDLAIALAPVFDGLLYEEVHVAYLDASSRLIDVQKLSEGGVDNATIDPTEIVNVAKRIGANQVALAHNHPGGNLFPSLADLQATENALFVLLPQRIKLVDHLLFTTEGYFSFFENGVIAELLQGVKGGPQIKETLEILPLEDKLKLISSLRAGDLRLRALCQRVYHNYIADNPEEANLPEDDD